MRFRSILVLGAVGFLACRTERTAAPIADSASVFLLRQDRQPAYAASGLFATRAYDEAVGTEVSEVAPFTPPDVIANMVIRTATASIEVDSLERAVTELKELASRLGGYVANSGIQVGSSRLRQAVIELKIPAARFEEVLAGLKPIGKLESVNVNAQDVGEEYVDVNARMENARRLERRLIDLLATRTGKLKDVLDVEQALARVRGEIERYEGRIRYLRAHTATSTLSVTVHEPIPVVGDAGRSVMGEAAKQAWRNFVVLISFVVQSLGVVIPLAVFALVAWYFVRRSRRVISHGAA